MSATESTEAVATKTCSSCGDCLPVSEFYSPGSVCKLCKAAKNKVWKDANAEKIRSWYKGYNRRQRLALRGMTEDEYEARLEAQGGVCAICKNPETALRTDGSGDIRHLAVDHDHETGEVRGLLCLRCNLALGKFKDDPVLLLRAADYLLKGAS